MASIQITVDTYGHLIPGANRAAVDRLDDDTVTHPAATQAQPEPFEDLATLREMQELFGNVVSRIGIEPITRRLRVCCSAN